MERGDLLLLYDDEGVVNITFQEFRCKDSEHQPFKPLQGGFGDEPRHWGAQRRTIYLLEVAVAKLEIVLRTMF